MRIRTVTWVTEPGGAGPTFVSMSEKNDRAPRGRRRRRRASAPLAAVFVAALMTPAVAAADGERVIVGLEGAVLFPVTEPQVNQLYPGPTFSVATQFSVTEYLMPLLRLRGGSVVHQPQTESGPDYHVSLMGGLRFRPRGIAHPEEPSRASCIWAEVAAGAAAWNDRIRPAFEAAIGFGFVVDAVTLGPVVRFAHVLSTESSDGPDAFLMTVGLEVLLNDAR